MGCDIAIIDEFGAHKDYSLYEVMRSSQLYKLDSQICIISTAYPNTTTSPCYKERCLLVDAYEGKLPMSDRYFSCIYELDEEDMEDYSNEDNWIKANPLLAQFPSIMDKMRTDFQDSIKESEKKNLFLTKNLNIWLNINNSESYLDFNSWLDCQVDEVDFENKEVVVGVDMSKSTDLTGVTIMARGDNGKIIMKSKAFLPKEIITDKEVQDKMPYTSYLYNNKDWLTATDGKFVNQAEIENYIRSIEDMYNCRIKSINFDSWGALHLMSALSQDYEVVDVRMSYRHFSPTVKRFREIVFDNKLEHEFNPILNFCVGNAVTKSDLQENILLDKKKSQNRIDLLVSAIIAYEEFVDEETTDDFGDYFVV